MDSLYIDSLKTAHTVNIDTLDIHFQNSFDSLMSNIDIIIKNTNSNQSECCNFWIIILLIIITGFLGGLKNFLFNKKNNSIKDFFHNILLGIIGASLIPLFLQLTASKLLDSCGNCFRTYLVLIGYMFIASIFSKRLLDNLGKKIFNLDDVKNEIDKAQTEPEVDIDLPEAEIKDIENKITNNSDKLSNNEKEQALKDTNKILSNLQGSRYKYRTLEGIAKSTNLDKNKVFSILSVLKQKNIIEEVIRDKKKYYTLTKLGEGIRLFEI